MIISLGSDAIGSGYFGRHSVKLQIMVKLKILMSSFGLPAKLRRWKTISLISGFVRKTYGKVSERVTNPLRLFLSTSYSGS